MPEDKSQQQSHQGTPKRRSTKSDIWASPTHRKITPTGLGEMLSGAVSRQQTPTGSAKDDEKVSPRLNPISKLVYHFLFQDPEPTIQELEAFYRDKIADLNKSHDDAVRMLKFRLRRFETRNSDDEYMVNIKFIYLIAHDNNSTCRLNHKLLHITIFAMHIIQINRSNIFRIHISLSLLLTVFYMCLCLTAWIYSFFICVAGWSCLVATISLCLPLS